MPPRRSASFPLYIDDTAVVTRTVVRARRLGRLALVAWAAAVYVVYWLLETGWR
jgi:hypothetical protein